MTDRLLDDIATYVLEYTSSGVETMEMARLCLMDTLGCGILALDHPDCARLVGPVVPGAVCPNGARVPGTSLELDPVQAAFCMGTMNRWLDYNDAWAGAEWGHPSDNLGGILSIADYIDRNGAGPAGSGVLVGDVLDSLVKAYEIQGVIALENSFNRLGFDHVLLVRVATSAVVTALLGGSHAQIVNAVSNAWVDGLTTRVYRARTGTRKNWAAGDATSRGVRLALMCVNGEMGYPTALTEPIWGFQDALFGGNDLVVNRNFANYVVNNVVFKVPYPAEGHALTACEAAVVLHPVVRDRLDDIDRIVIETQEPAMRIINKTGPLHNFADRDHCLQYMVAVCLLNGTIEYADYLDHRAGNPEIDRLRGKMEVSENARFSRDYSDPLKRSVANALQVFFSNGDHTERIEVEYPAGHPVRRKEGKELVADKFRSSMATRFPVGACNELIILLEDTEVSASLPVSQFMELLIDVRN